MRIDGTSGFDPYGVPKDGNASSPKSQKGAGAGESGRDYSLDLLPVVKDYVQRALAGGQVNAEAVAETKRLLDSGQLDGAESISRAAEAILRRGI